MQGLRELYKYRDPREYRIAVFCIALFICAAGIEAFYLFDLSGFGAVSVTVLVIGILAYLGKTYFQHENFYSIEFKHVFLLIALDFVMLILVLL